jgi:hypothetical protein
MIRKCNTAVMMALVVALALGSALFFPGVSQAATFQYYGSILTLSGGALQAHSESSGSSSGASDSKSTDATGWQSVATSSSLIIPPFPDYTMVAGNTIWGGGNYGWTDPSYALLGVYGAGEYASTDSSSIFSSHSFCRTDYGLGGLYLQLVPTAGENWGDSVSVNFLWTASASMDLGWTGYLSGSTESGDIKVTLNDYTGTGSVVWSHAAVTVDSAHPFSGTYSTVLSLSIGDILGIHLGAGAQADLSGYHYAPITYSLKNQVEFAAPAVPLPSTLPLLGSGLLGLAGWRTYKRG